MTKSDNEAWDLFDTLSENSQHHASSRFLKPPLSQTTPKKGGMYEVSNLAVYQKMYEITHRLDQITTTGTLAAQTSSNPQEPTVACMICSSTEHLPTGCPSASQFPDLVQEYVHATQSYTQPGSNPFSNTYNPGWRDHPNFGWKTGQNQSSLPYGTTPQPRFQQAGVPFQQGGQPRFPPNNQFYNQPSHPTPPIQNTPSLEGKMDQLLNAFQAMDSKFQGQQQIMNSHTQSISKLESQMGQIANALTRIEEERLLA